MSRAIASISFSPMPAVVTAGVPMRRPAADERRTGVVGDLVLVEGDPGPIEGLLGLLAGQLGVEGAQVDQHQMVVGAPRDDAKPLRRQGRRQRPGVLDDLGGVLPELRLGRLPERHGLGRDDVLQRAALQPGKTALSMAGASRPVHRMAPPAGAP